MRSAEARLVRHPLAPWSGPALAIAVRCDADDGVECRFELTGPIAALAVPAPAARDRVDGLWRHTCFELFAARRGAAAYREFNFAPSGAWAAYAFASYREPDAAPALPAPEISTEVSSARLALTARLAPGCWPQGAQPLELGLAAVVETARGELGYFALHHPGERPDFHDRRGFTLALAGTPSPP
jgi:hypothetical protein